MSRIDTPMQPNNVLTHVNSKKVVIVLGAAQVLVWCMDSVPFPNLVFIDPLSGNRNSVYCHDGLIRSAMFTKNATKIVRAVQGFIKNAAKIVSCGRCTRRTPQHWGGGAQDAAEDFAGLSRKVLQDCRTEDCRRGLQKRDIVGCSRGGVVECIAGGFAGLSTESVEVVAQVPCGWLPCKCPSPDALA
eukprot:1160142-Pelagomonas_calceolata.AAC.11